MSAEKPLVFHKIIPNLITLMAMCAGMSAIQFAVNGKWEHAVAAIVVAAVLDALDGAIARLLKATSDFGAQLDSLSDFLAFGVAPALVVHMWFLGDAGKLGWVAALVFAVATALRLARFNVMQASLRARPVWSRGFFAGVPAPAGAGLVLLPVFVWLQAPDFFSALGFATPLVALWMLFVAGLMVSRIPTFSIKHLRIPAKMAMPVLAGAVVLIAALIHVPWMTLTVLCLLYLASLPLSLRKFRALERDQENSGEESMSDLAMGAVEWEDGSRQMQDVRKTGG